MRQRLEDGLCIWRTFDDLYPSRQSANRAIKGMVEAGVAESVGSVTFRGEAGVSYVYTALKKVRRNQLRHDVIRDLVKFELGYDYLDGEDLDDDRRPDLRIYAANEINFEIDSGATTYGEIKEERMPVWNDSEEPVVWVSCGLWSTSDETRLEGLRALTKSKNAWFVTLQNVLDNGEEAELVNGIGGKTTIRDLATVPAQPSPAAEVQK